MIKALRRAETHSVGLGEGGRHRQEGRERGRGFCAKSYDFPPLYLKILFI